MLPDIGYLRVSTGSPEQVRSAEGQEFKLLQAGCSRVIMDRLSASDYARKRRPGWDELRLLVARRAIRRIRFIDLSRLARDGTDQDLLQEAHVAGVEVVDLFGKVWENHTPDGLLSSGILSVVNRVHSRILSVKVKDGIARRREMGFLARGKLPFGYLHLEGKAVEHPQNWAHARQLVEDLLSKQMNVSGTLGSLPPDFPWKPSCTGLKTWWRNPMLRGGMGLHLNRNTKAYGEVIWNVAPALLTWSEWETGEAMARARARGRPREGSGNRHLFTSLIRCGACGKFLQWHVDKAKSRRPRYACKNRHCKWFGRGLSEQPIKEAVAAALVRKAEEMEQMLAHPPENDPPELVALRDQLERLQRLEAEGVEGLRPGMIRLRDQIAFYQMPRTDLLHIPGADVALRDPRAFLDLRDEALRPICLQFLKVVYLGGPGQFRVDLL